MLLKKQSIPRLELLGAVPLARLVHQFKSNKRELENNQMNRFDDCLVLDQERANVETVRSASHGRKSKLTSKDDSRHCPGKLNPADIPSHGLSAKELSTNTTWWNGAAFLYQPKS